MIHVLGIDAGGTKTVCQLADGEGNVLAEARGGGANLQAVGELQVEKVLHEVMEEAIGDRADRPRGDLPRHRRRRSARRCDDRARDHEAHRLQGARARRQRRARRARSRRARGSPASSSSRAPGRSRYGRNAQGEAARSGGWGYVLGDEGSGYWIGRSALRAVLREADERGPKTALTPLLLEHFGVGQAQGLIHEVYHTNLKPAAIGALARSVQAAFLAGRPGGGRDPARGGQRARVGSDVGGPPARTDRQAVPFILAGGIFRAVPWLEEELTRRLPVVARGAAVRLLDREPASGAVALALQEAAGGAAIPRYKAD